MFEDKSATLVMFQHSSNQASIKRIVFDQQNMNLFLHDFHSSEQLPDSQPEIGDGFSTAETFSRLEKEFAAKEGGESRLQQPFPRAVKSHATAC
jgi:hypothetical protein